MNELAVAQHAKRVGTAMRDAACGPLIIAQEVMLFAERWSSKEQTYAAFLAEILGPKKAWLRFFRRRAEAVERIGEHARRTWHHEAAVWAVDAIVDAEGFNALCDAVQTAFLENARNPLSRYAVYRIARERGLIEVERVPSNHVVVAAMGLLRAWDAGAKIDTEIEALREALGDERPPMAAE